MPSPQLRGPGGSPSPVPLRVVRGWGASVLPQGAGGRCLLHWDGRVPSEIWWMAGFEDGLRGCGLLRSCGGAVVSPGAALSPLSNPQIMKTAVSHTAPAKPPSPLRALPGQSLGNSDRSRAADGSGCAVPAQLMRGGARGSSLALPAAPLPREPQVGGAFLLAQEGSSVYPSPEANFASVRLHLVCFCE